MTEPNEQTSSDIINARLDSLTEQMISLEERLNHVTDSLTTIIEQFTDVITTATNQTPNNSTLKTLKPNGNEN